MPELGLSIVTVGIAPVTTETGTKSEKLILPRSSVARACKFSPPGELA